MSLCASSGCYLRARPWQVLGRGDAPAPPVCVIKWWAVGTGRAGQRLLLLPADGKRLSDYSIGPNSKLNLVVKPLEKVLREEKKLAEGPPAPPAAWQLVSQILARHFSTADASRVMDQLQRVRRGTRAP